MFVEANWPLEYPPGSIWCTLIGINWHLDIQQNRPEVVERITNDGYDHFCVPRRHFCKARSREFSKANTNRWKAPMESTSKL